MIYSLRFLSQYTRILTAGTVVGSALWMNVDDLFFVISISVYAYSYRRDGGGVRLVDECG
jgi:hypothetical protein